MPAMKSPFAILLALLAPCCGQVATAVDRPNIVLIFADDLGYGDVGCYGSKLVPTPAIDSLARGGVRCTDGYVTAPVCAPSRCGIMTGAYNQRFGMQWNDDRRKYSVGQHKLLPQALRAAGYVTGHVGKWNIPVDPKDCFDEIHDLIDWEADFFPDKNGHYHGVDSDTEFASSKVQGVWGPERPGDEYLTDRIGRHAVEFITKHKRSAKPFFLYLAFNAVHSPWHGKKQFQARFDKLMPPLSYYAAMIASMDENIGRVLAALPKNTLVAFTSDNGPAMGSSRIVVWPEGWPEKILVGSAGPLNGHKAQFLEGGIRVPFLVRWPGQLKAGSVYRQPVSTMDLYATFCAAAGAAVPEGTKLDGVNLLPFLTGKNTGAPREILFWKNGEDGAVRHGDWKLFLSSSEPKRQLFHLGEDIGEQRDLAGEKPDIAQRLHKAWQDWSATVPPRANPPPAKGKSTQDRPAIFKTKDKDRDGKLTREEFLANQQDPKTAKLRFDQWDTDKDGFLNLEEFVNMGSKR
ncbi:MAG: sulfatase [Verrucomicrobia bacterium]|nr:sulfatase [Verrucomicrobiota bacterium]